jgi:hypothetical protein
MESHIGFFHLITNIGYTSTSWPIFVLLPNRFIQGGITKHNCDNNTPESLADVALIIHREPHFIHDGVPVSFPAGI